MSVRRPTSRLHIGTIHEKYLRLLKRPDLSAREIEIIRKHMTFLVQTICEHV